MLASTAAFAPSIAASDEPPKLLRPTLAVRAGRASLPWPIPRRRRRCPATPRDAWRGWRARPAAVPACAAACRLIRCVVRRQQRDARRRRATANAAASGDGCGRGRWRRGPLLLLAAREHDNGRRRRPSAARRVSCTAPSLPSRRGLLDYRGRHGHALATPAARVGRAGGRAARVRPRGRRASAKAGRRSVVRVIVDSDGGVDLDAVADVSKAVSDALDEADPLGEQPYVLEVTSPGVDRPLTEPRHWRRNIGRKVKAGEVDRPDPRGHRRRRGHRGQGRGRDDLLRRPRPEARSCVEFNRPSDAVMNIDVTALAGWSARRTSRSTRSSRRSSPRCSRRTTAPRVRTSTPARSSTARPARSRSGRRRSTRTAR